MRYLLASMNEPEVEKKLNARRYLHTYRIQWIWRQIISELIEFQPIKPMPFILDRLQVYKPMLDQNCTEKVSEWVDRFPVHFPRVFALLGGPCSGKVAQGTFLSERYGCYKINFRQYLIDSIYKQTSLGISVQKFVNSFLADSSKFISNGGYATANHLLPSLNVSITSKVTEKFKPSLGRTVDYLQSTLPYFPLDLLRETCREAMQQAPPDSPVIVLIYLPYTLMHVRALEEGVVELSLGIYLHCSPEISLQRMMESTSRKESHEDKIEAISHFQWQASSILEYLSVLGKLEVINANETIEKTNELLKEMLKRRLS